MATPKPKPLIPAREAIAGGVLLALPLLVKSEANAHEHWRTRNRRRLHHLESTRIHLLAARAYLPPLPVDVAFCRHGSRRLDSDNLAGAFKYVRDAVAAFYGVSDDDWEKDAPIRWSWSQSPGGAKYTAIRITARLG